MAHRVTVFFDYHCPYSYRAARWLAALGPDLVIAEYRFLPLEQLNRDPEAAAWRIWEQPLDYEHHRGRADRRSLAAFLATAFAEGGGAPPLEPGGVERLRLAIFAARHDERLDIADPAVLDRIATSVGLASGWLASRFADPDAVAAARARIAADWAATRAPFRCFGVPTLVVDGGPPVYLRLARVPAADEGERLLAWLIERSSELPFVLELKLPDRVDGGAGAAGPRAEATARPTTPRRTEVDGPVAHEPVAHEPTPTG